MVAQFEQGIHPGVGLSDSRTQIRSYVGLEASSATPLEQGS